MDKKAALQLSVNAIIVFVLAFAMLGVGLTVTNLLSSKVEAGVDIIDVSELVIDEPSSSEPITLPNKIKLPRGKQTELQVGYYNTNSDTAMAAALGIAKCLNSENTLVTTEELPTVVSLSADVSPSDSNGYSVVIKETGDLDPDTYVCTMLVFNNDDYTSASAAYEARSENPSPVYESDSFFLDITS